MFQQARSSAQEGFEAVVIAPHDKDEVRDGVRVLAVPPFKSRSDRVFRTTFCCLKRAWAEQPDIYCLHTPDLIPWVLLLRLAGRKVIYDVVEDYSHAAMVRSWLSDWARPLVASSIKFVNFVAGKTMTIVIAERYYSRSFPRVVEVLNYAPIEEYEHVAKVDINQESF